jgi:hypothetical protein
LLIDLMASNIATTRALNCALGCKRNVSLRVAPTVEKERTKSLTSYLKTLFSKHKDVPPPDFIPKFNFKNVTGRVPVYHFNDRIEDLRKNTSPGVKLRKHYKTKSDVIDDLEFGRPYLRRYAHNIKTGLNKDIQLPCRLVNTSSKRNIISGEIKRRVAFVFPLEVLAIENMFYAPIKDVIANIDYILGTHLHLEYCSHASLNCDFSSFDASVPQWLVRAAFHILFNMLDLSKYANYGEPKSKYSLYRLWCFVVNYYLRTPFLYRGRVLFAHDGVPSGGMFTNVLDTIIGKLVLSYLCRCGAKIRTYGDDGIMANCVCSRTRLMSDAKSVFGLTLKLEAPNEHGCLTYLKVECHQGVGFRPGLDYANVLNTTDESPGPVAHCLSYLTVTKDQLEELDYITMTNEDYVSERTLNALYKILEYSKDMSRHPTDL